MPPWWGDLSCPDVILNGAKISILFYMFQLIGQKLRYFRKDARRVQSLRPAGENSKEEIVV